MYQQSLLVLHYSADYSFSSFGFSELSLGYSELFTAPLKDLLGAWVALHKSLLKDLLGAWVVLNKPLLKDLLGDVGSVA